MEDVWQDELESSRRFAAWDALYQYVPQMRRRERHLLESSVCSLEADRSNKIVDLVIAYKSNYEILKRCSTPNSKRANHSSPLASPPTATPLTPSPHPQPPPTSNSPPKASPASLYHESQDLNLSPRCHPSKSPPSTLRSSPQIPDPSQPAAAFSRTRSA